MDGRYIGRVINMYDGDTLTVAIHNESGKLESLQIRVMGCDTPELKGSTSEAGIAAKNAALVYLGADDAQGLTNGRKLANYFQENPIFVELQFVPQKEKFGRFLAHVRSPKKEETLTAHLIRNDLATPYKGGTKDQTQFVTHSQGGQTQFVTHSQGNCKEHSQSDHTTKHVSSAVILQNLKDQIFGDSFKNETDDERNIIVKIYYHVSKNPNDYIDSLDKLQRKRIVRKLRSAEIDNAEDFIGQL